MDILTNWLHDAIYISNNFTAKIYIKMGANINECDKFGDPPLQQAILKENYEMVTILLKHKANPNKLCVFYDKTKKPILMNFIYSRNKSLIQLFILHSAKTDNISYRSQDREMISVVAASGKLYQELTQLQTSLNEDKENPWAYRKLANFWKKLAVTEENIDIKKYYFELGNEAGQQAEKIAQNIRTKHAPHDSSILTNLFSKFRSANHTALEKTPLITASADEENKNSNHLKCE